MCSFLLLLFNLHIFFSAAHFPINHLAGQTKARLNTAFYGTAGKCIYICMKTVHNHKVGTWAIFVLLLALEIMIHGSRAILFCAMALQQLFRDLRASTNFSNFAAFRAVWRVRYRFLFYNWIFLFFIFCLLSFSWFFMFLWCYLIFLQLTYKAATKKEWLFPIQAFSVSFTNWERWEIVDVDLMMLSQQKNVLEESRKSEITDWP